MVQQNTLKYAFLNHIAMLCVGVSIVFYFLLYGKTKDKINENYILGLVICICLAGLFYGISAIINKCIMGPKKNVLAKDRKAIVIGYIVIACTAIFGFLIFNVRGG